MPTTSVDESDDSVDSLDNVVLKVSDHLYC